MNTPNTCNPMNVVVNTYASCNSLNGTYFIGKTDLLTFGDGTTGIALLYNPITSGAYIYLNTIGFTNTGACPFLANLWYYSTAVGTLTTSMNVVCPNTTLFPPAVPTATILFANSGTITGGVSPLVREVPCYSTVLRDDVGETILAPGESLILSLEPNTTTSTVSGYISFRWWEAF